MNIPPWNVVVVFRKTIWLSEIMGNDIPGRVWAYICRHTKNVFVICYTRLFCADCSRSFNRSFSPFLHPCNHFSCPAEWINRKNIEKNKVSNCVSKITAKHLFEVVVVQVSSLWTLWNLYRIHQMVSRIFCNYEFFKKLSLFIYSYVILM